MMQTYESTVTALMKWGAERSKSSSVRKKSMIGLFLKPPPEGANTLWGFKMPWAILYHKLGASLHSAGTTGDPGIPQSIQRSFDLG